MKIHIGDTGTTFYVTIKKDKEIVDISGTTEKKIIFDKPNANGVFSKDASFVTDGSDGKLKYTTEADDLDTAGIWKMQAVITLPTGKWHTGIAEFQVFGNLDD